MPVLNHNGRIVWETLAILEYLADLVPGAEALAGRFAARALARSCRDRNAFGLSRGALWLADKSAGVQKAYKPLDAEGEKQRQRIETIWRECRGKYGKGGPFLFGHFTRPTRCTRRL